MIRNAIVWYDKTIYRIVTFHQSKMNSSFFLSIITFTYKEGWFDGTGSFIEAIEHHILSWKFNETKEV